MGRPTSTYAPYTACPHVRGPQQTLFAGVASLGDMGPAFEESCPAHASDGEKQISPLPLRNDKQKQKDGSSSARIPTSLRGHGYPIYGPIVLNPDAVRSGRCRACYSDRQRRGRTCRAESRPYRDRQRGDRVLPLVLRAVRRVGRR